MRRGLILTVIFTAFTLVVPVRLRAADDWKFDVLRLKNGSSLRGLLVEETPTEVRFKCVRRHPGSPTIVISAVIPRGQIEGIDRLDAKERAVLAERIKQLDPTGKRETLRMEQLKLRPAPWITKDKGPGLKYTSAHFVLLSNAREDIVRRAAVRLEQIYAAYARFLPPRRPSAKPTTILLIRSLAEYKDYLNSQGRHILNPAFYDVKNNRIVCASDLEHLGEELERARKHHQQLLEKLKKQEADLKQQFRGQLPATVHDQIRAYRRKIYLVNRKNNENFQTATRHLFQTLYHEAFHAYLGNFVYPPDEAEVPRWLNEGLAQIFESAIVEAGELQVGYAGADRLVRLRAAARQGQWLPLTDMLTAGQKEFVIAHASDKRISDRYYLYSWALAYYLTFGRKLLGTPALDKYVHALKHGKDPLVACRDLVGEPLPRLEQTFHQYVLNLRPDGTVASTPPAKASKGN